MFKSVATTAVRGGAKIINVGASAASSTSCSSVGALLAARRRKILWSTSSRRPAAAAHVVPQHPRYLSTVQSTKIMCAKTTTGSSSSSSGGARKNGPSSSNSPAWDDLSNKQNTNSSPTSTEMENIPSTASPPPAAATSSPTTADGTLTVDVLTANNPVAHEDQPPPPPKPPPPPLPPFADEEFTITRTLSQQEEESRLAFQRMRRLCKFDHSEEAFLTRSEFKRLIDPKFGLVQVELNESELNRIVGKFGMDEASSYPPPAPAGRSGTSDHADEPKIYMDSFCRAVETTPYLRMLVHEIVYHTTLFDKEHYQSETSSCSRGSSGRSSETVSETNEGPHSNIADHAQHDQLCSGAGQDHPGLSPPPAPEHEILDHLPTSASHDAPSRSVSKDAPTATTIALDHQPFDSDTDDFSICNSSVHEDEDSGAAASTGTTMMQQFDQRSHNNLLLHDNEDFAGDLPGRRSSADDHPLDTSHYEVLVDDDLLGSTASKMRPSFARTISKNDYTIPENYDFSKSTEENYSVPHDSDNVPPGGNKTNTNKFVGPFKQIRQTLMDYSYHGAYCESRQHWQDNCIRKSVLLNSNSNGLLYYGTTDNSMTNSASGGSSAGVVTTPTASNTNPQQHFSPVLLRKRSTSPTYQSNRPWLILTCGSMGSGKGWVLGWMSSKNILPLESISKIDPDHFKTLMPEWKQYLKQSLRQAGTLCHKESGYIAEIAQEVAMKQNLTLWVDGSLHNYEFYTKKIAYIRQNYPQYKIAILAITASDEIIANRLKKRAKETGRVVPPARARTAAKALAVAVPKLIPLVDFYARIDNDVDIVDQHPARLPGAATSSSSTTSGPRLDYVEIDGKPVDLTLPSPGSPVAGDGLDVGKDEAVMRDKEQGEAASSCGEKLKSNDPWMWIKRVLATRSS
ncbi:unnamed protein product [Amoebophrya sp. A120]|nr:unnamed protein product [Amoebophrya sp. A120]|eukprot:GSA120T00022438001.1